MKWIHIVVVPVVLVVAGALVYLWTGSPERTAYEAAWESAEIERGPIRHEELPADLRDRIRELAVAFSEVHPISYEEWLDGFQRDRSPESEVAIWEEMARSYTEFLREYDLDEAARREAFGLLLVRTGTDDMEPYFSELEHLSIDQARRLVESYRADPKPITVQRDG